MAFNPFSPKRVRDLEHRIRHIEEHLANLSLDPATLEQLLAAGSGFGGSGGGGGSTIHLPLPESQVRFDESEGHTHDGTKGGGTKVAHANLTTPGSALLDGSRHSDTGADAVVVGDLIIGDTGPLWRRLAIGTATYVLKVVGGKPAWGQVAHSELAGTGSALLDGSRHSDTAAGTVVAGDLVTGNATPAWSRLARGTSGYFLKAGASVLAWAQIAFTDITGAITAAQHGNLTSTAGTTADHDGTLNANARSAIKKNGTLVGTRRGINLIEGTNVTITVVDDSGNEEVDVTIAQTGVTAGTVVVQEGDVTVEAAAATLDFAAADFNVTSSPAGEANIAWQGFTVEEGNVSVATDIKDLDFGAGFDVTASGGEAEIALDLSEVVTGDVNFLGNASQVRRVYGNDVTPSSPTAGTGLAWDTSANQFKHWRRDFILHGWSRADISLAGTSYGVMPHPGANGTNINAPFVPHLAGRFKGISVSYDGNVDPTTDSHTVAVFKNGVATALTVTVTGANDKGTAAVDVTFAANDDIDVRDLRTGVVSGVGVHVWLFGIWEE